MNIYLDTEFITKAKEQTLKPLSIALVTESGESLYLVISDAPREEGDEFVQRFVVPYLDLSPIAGEEIPERSLKTIRGHTFGSFPRDEIRKVIIAWIGARTSVPKFWAWYASYDWVCFCDLLGGFLNLPLWMPQYIHDLRTKTSSMLPYVGTLELPEHHCLRDAFQLKQTAETVK